MNTGHCRMQRMFRVAFVDKQSEDLLCLLLDDCLTVSRLITEVCSSLLCICVSSKQ